ncbi:hypothetical protein [Desulfosediminicola flagellatus]|uniref:hypothetical protein n=1 Tax=Desulfosediminicola flagellatus TaxID=2569541 RepID=UPI0010AD009A|nr:hypothetical protein [Desulfosediminicola flagellatus]
MTKQFFMLHGRNGATYVFNAGSLSGIRESLKFYKALTLKGKVMKSALFVVLLLLGKLRLTPLWTGKDVSNYLGALPDEQIAFELDGHCSVHVAPTRDKVIIHRHGRCFEKVAFGGSYAGVSNEALVYRGFAGQPRLFSISRLESFEDHGSYCHFAMSHDSLPPAPVGDSIDWSAVLAEFFVSQGGSKDVLFGAYVSALREACERGGWASHAVLDALFDHFSSTYGDERLPLGLVHRDFKPWNVLPFSKPLIFDFEETINDGLPCEDLLNYFIDPIINYQSTEAVQAILFGEPVQQALVRYSKALGLSVPVEFFIFAYLINRVLFWRARGDDQTADRYAALFDACCSSRTWP